MAINSPLNRHNLIISVNIFVKKEDKYLVLKRSSFKKVAPDFLHPVGGKADNNEDPYVTAQRELMEEAGIKATNIRFRGLVTEVYPQDGNLYQGTWQIFYFLGEYLEGNIKETEEGELMWKTKEEISSANLFPSIKKILKFLINEEYTPVFAKCTYDISGSLVNTEINTFKLDISNEVIIQQSKFKS